MFARFALIACLAVTPGCVSFLTVEKAGEDTEGIRYSLPQPFLLVKPSEAAGVVVEVVYLPDPTNEYAIESRSYLAATKFDVTIESGLLKQVVFNPDASAVASQLIESAGNIGVAEVDAKAAAAKTAADAKAAAQKNVSEAQGALLKAESKLASLQAASDNDLADRAGEIKKANLAVIDAKAALAEAEESARAGGFNTPARQGVVSAPALPQAWGPVLYRIVEGPNGVELRAVEAQALRDTYKPQTKTAPKVPALSIKGSSVIRADTAGAFQLSIESDLALDSVVSVDLVDANGTKVPNGILGNSLQLSKKEIIVDVDAGVAAAKYKVSVVYKFKGKSTRKDVNMTIAK